MGPRQSGDLGHCGNPHGHHQRYVAGKINMPALADHVQLACLVSDRYSRTSGLPRSPMIVRHPSRGLRQWTYGSEPRRSKKNSTNNTLGAFTDTLLLTRTEDTLVADGTRTTTIDHADDKIKVKNEWNVQTVRADSMSSQHKASWDKL